MQESLFSRHWLEGGKGAEELAKIVIEACNDENEFKFLYDEDAPLREKIYTIATEVYGADGVSYTEIAQKKS